MVPGASWDGRGRLASTATGDAKASKPTSARSATLGEKLRVLGDEFRDLGDRVLVLGRVKGRGRGSGVEVEAPLAIIFDFRDGKMSRSKAYLDHDEALRAAGLAE